MKPFFFISALLLFSNIILGQITKKYSNAFLDIGVGARALGMANTMVSNIADVDAAYWNPAGLLSIKDRQISLMHSAHFANIANYDYLAYAAPIAQGSAFAIALIRFAVDDILDTTSLVDADGNIDYNRVQLFSAADYAFTFSYARQLAVPQLRLGANARIVRRIIGDFASSWGYGFDLGIQYAQGAWNFGVMFRDVTTSFNAWTVQSFTVGDLNNDGIADEDQLPQLQNQEIPTRIEITIPKLQLGASHRLMIRPKFHLLTAVDLRLRFVETKDLLRSKYLSVSPSLGIECNYNRLFFVRGGIGNFQEINTFDGSKKITFQPNIGIGFRYHGIAIDYALTDIGDQSIAIYSNVFSVQVDWAAF